MRKIFIVTASVLIISSTQAVSQSIRGDIQNRLIDQLGMQGYKVSSIVSVDSAKGNAQQKYAQDEIEDPYGTLTSCYLFSALRSPSTYTSGKIVGIFRDETIIWHSDTTVSCDAEGGEIFGSRDLNLDGTVDIMVTWDNYNITASYGSMWIYSWDGTQGRRINHVDSNQSVISGNEPFELMDLDGDGILEITSSSGDDNSKEVWSWNGTEYGKWPSTPNTITTKLLRRNATASMHCETGKVDSLYEYTYSIQNSVASKRRIDEFYIECTSPTIVSDSVTVDNWRFVGPSGDFPFMNWYVDRRIGWTPIKIGELRAKRYTVRSAAPPGIFRFYVQSENEIVTADNSTLDDVTTNSTSGFTIAPREPASPLDLQMFLDTMKSNINQSLPLGWIQNAQVVERYTRFVDSARSELQRNDIRAARATLDSITTNATSDSGSVLASDAYALIFINTTYLLSQLPAPPPQYTLTLTITGIGTVTPLPDLPLYDSASIVQLTANPATGFKFSGWSGDTTGTANPITIPMNMNRSITATFVIDHNLSVPAKFSTIQGAVNFARHGDTVVVSPGTYNESVIINSKDSLVVLATGGVDQVTLQSFSIEMSNSVVIRGFDVNASGLQIVAAISLDSDTSVTIESNQIRNCSKDGISLPYGGAGCIATRIVNNRIHDNARYGIDLVDISGNITYLINNTIVKNSYYGVYIDGQQAAALVNNILAFNTRYGLYRNKIISPSRPGNSITPNPNPDIVTLLNNLAIGNNGTVSSTWPNSSKDLGNYGYFLDATDGGNITTAGNEGTGVSGSSSQAITNVFVSSSPLDLHLKSGSVAINHGVNSWSAPDPIAGAIPSVDFEGTDRPLGGTDDIGADEAY